MKLYTAQFLGFETMGMLIIASETKSRAKDLAELYIEDLYFSDNYQQLEKL